MSSHTAVRGLYRGMVALLIVGMCTSVVSLVQAGNFRFGAVGGVLIREDGVVRNAVLDQRHNLAKVRKEEIKLAGAEMNQAVQIRKISLKALEAACRQALAENSGQLPDDIRYLGGLQRVQYVFVYPEQNDVVLAGPAEGWRIDEVGSVVGITTGRPVLQLDDLVVALRSVESARRGGISCSINPTQQGYRSLNSLLEKQRHSGQAVNVPALEQAMKKAFGLQQVTLTGVPPTTHFARVLVAADYRMKRLAMKLDESPIAGLPSFVEMIKHSRTQTTSVNPRWWMACNYEPMVHSADGLAWELRGQGVKCLTEDEFITREGHVKQTGRVNPQAQKWANLMTEKFDELSVKEPIFGELRNVMDLSIIAAVIDQNDLFGQANCQVPVLLGQSGDLMPYRWFAPSQVPPECSFLRTGSGWVVTASGGVQINSFQVATRVETSDAVASVRKRAAGSASTWWWN